MASIRQTLFESFVALSRDFSSAEILDSDIMVSVLTVH